MRAEQLRIVTEVAAERVAENHNPVVRVVAGGAVSLVEPVGAPAAPAVGDDDRNMGQRVAQQVRQIVERISDELLEVVVVERIELHELAFLRSEERRVGKERRYRGS